MEQIQGLPTSLFHEKKYIKILQGPDEDVDRHASDA